ncbi:hypothetical protein EK904_013744, partial [Melospiza melodia maxima]
FSALLEVNKEGTKVRRRLPIPEHLLSIPPSKLLLVWELQPREQDLPLQKTFLDTITRIFSPFGAIASIRLLRPGRKLPSDVRSAADSIGQCDWRSGIRVVRLSGKGGKKKASEERAAWKVPPPPALSIPRSPREGSLPCGDAAGSLSFLLHQELLAPTWPGGDFTPGHSRSFPCSFLPELGVGTESCPGGAAGSWTPWGSGLCPKGSLSDAQGVSEPLSLWDGVLPLPHSPKSFRREELVLRR